MSEYGDLEPEVRLHIRSRARQIKRRRHAWVGGAVASILATAGTAVAVSHPDQPPRVTTVMAAPGCPAASTPVQIRVGQSASLPQVPQGWVITSGSPGSPEMGVTYSSPAAQSQAAAMEKYTSYTAASVGIVLGFPSLGEVTPVPPVGHPSFPPPPAGISTSSTAIDGLTAQIRITAPPDGHAASPAYPQTESITWSPAAGTTVSVDGTNILPPELLQIARSATYQLGHLVQLPATPTFKIRSSAAIRTLPADHGSGAVASLTSLNEVAIVGSVHLPNAPDDQSVWLAYAPTDAGRVDWSVVDAQSGQVIVSARDQKADWVRAITDRSKPGCEPPLGVLTRSELFRGPAPAGTALSLVTGIEAMSYTQAGQQYPCDPQCDELDWMSYPQSGRSMSVVVYDALTGEMRSSVQGPGPVAEPMPRDLDPGPTVTAPPLTLPGAPTTSVTAPTAPAIVGPSPYYPGTYEPKPAPAGNGKGLHGSCNGSETYPPCGPGVVQDEYYPYTLPTNCSGYLYLDGRYWQQELYEPDQPTMNVWISVHGDGAGWVGPGAVGIVPAPSASPPPCGTSPQSIPPLSTNG